MNLQSEKKTYVPVSVLGLTDCGKYFSFSETISLSVPRNGALIFLTIFIITGIVPNKWEKYIHLVLSVHNAQQKYPVRIN